MKHGYILVEFDRTEIVADQNVHTGGLYDAYPNGDFGAVAGWAWGFHRVVDYLHTLPNVDARHIAATGHSRGGKAVLLAGAMDERIALTAPNDAGCMGTGCTRFIYSGETVPIILKNFPYWFSPHLAEFIGHEEQLPFDQHSMKALIAPRALLGNAGIGRRVGQPQRRAGHLSGGKSGLRLSGRGRQNRHRVSSRQTRATALGLANPAPLRRPSILPQAQRTEFPRTALSRRLRARLLLDSAGEIAITKTRWLKDQPECAGNVRGTGLEPVRLTTQVFHTTTVFTAHRFVVWTISLPCLTV